MEPATDVIIFRLIRFILNSLALKKNWFIFILSVLILITGSLIFSCKHEIIYPSDYGYKGTPYVTNNLPTEPNVPTDKPCNPDTVFFDNQILPIFTSNCNMCHNAGGEENFSLTSYNAVMHSGTISPGNPNRSKLYEKIIATVGGEDNDRMPPPPKSALTQDQIDIIKKWILQGAKYYKCNSCDTTNFTFSGAIFPVIQNHCLGCHSGSSLGGGVSLANYDDIVYAVDKGKLMCAIKYGTGCKAMPQLGSQLSGCVISKFDKWIKNGKPKI